MHEIAEFLSVHPPFDTLSDDELAAVAAASEIEFAAAGTTILEQDVATPEHAWVVRRGSVELLDRQRVVDLLGEGEMFGHAALLSEWPTALAVRAHEDTLCYRIPADVIRPVLGRPAALRFAARSLAGRYEMRRPEIDPLSTRVIDPAHKLVGELLRGPAVIAPPTMSVRAAAERMVETGSTSLLVDLGDGFGIVTDRDLRTRVVAAGAPPETPVSEVMTTPARTISADATGADALLEMLDRGVRHLPVLDASRNVVGVISDTDLLAVETRTPFHLRRAIGVAASVDEVVAAARQLPATIIALHDARAAAVSIGRVIATVNDALTRRLIELAEADLGSPPARYTWLALGSIARRAAFPSSDQDSAIAWEGDGEDAEVAAAVRAIAARVVDGLGRCGIPACPNGAVASKPLFSRSLGRWEAVARSWLEDPDQTKALILTSVLIDGRPVWAADVAAERLARVFAGAPDHPLLLHRLGVFAIAHRVPTGFFRDFVVSDDGRRRGTLDIKAGGLVPVIDLARWAGMSAGVGAASTTARLDAAEAAGTLPAEEVATLRVAFELFTDLRMQHQVAALREGRPPDDSIDPKRLEPLTRRYLKSAFQAVAQVQRTVANSMGLRPR
jgi:CBS domain-containing protein